MKSKKKIKIIIIAASVLATVLLIWTLWGNTALTVSEIKVRSEDIPKGFDDFRIAHISDLHNANFGENNSKLVSMLRDTEPDIIVITGDIVDSRSTDIDIAVDFAKQAVQIAPTYYVPGNHESRIAEYNELKSGLENAGVTVLSNRSIRFQRNGDSVVLAGVNDPDFGEDFDYNLRKVTGENEGYTILLSHKPEYFDDYVECKADLVFSGHAHGGQFRLPFIGGCVAPGQGFFPEYDSGIYTEGKTSMIVSRGIGNSIIPLRFNNRPEIVLAVLESI